MVTSAQVEVCVVTLDEALSALAPLAFWAGLFSRWRAVSTVVVLRVDKEGLCPEEGEPLELEILLFPEDRWAWQSPPCLEHSVSGWVLSRKLS